MDSIEELDVDDWGLMTDMDIDMEEDSQIRATLEIRNFSLLKTGAIDLEQLLQDKPAH
jgi:hypothetical protein